MVALLPGRMPLSVSQVGPVIPKLLNRLGLATHSGVASGRSARTWLVPAGRLGDDGERGSAEPARW